MEHGGVRELQLNTGSAVSLDSVNAVSEGFWVAFEQSRGFLSVSKPFLDGTSFSEFAGCLGLLGFTSLPGASLLLAPWELQLYKGGALEP